MGVRCWVLGVGLLSFAPRARCAKEERRRLKPKTQHLFVTVLLAVLAALEEFGRVAAREVADVLPDASLAVLLARPAEPRLVAPDRGARLHLVRDREVARLVQEDDGELHV